jgi:hypothetical protein
MKLIISFLLGGAVASAIFVRNDFAHLVQSHYWGTGSEWFWAFGQCVVVAATLIFIARQVKLQTTQTEFEAMSHVVQAVCTIQERWFSETMQRVRGDVCSRWKNGKREFDGACEHIAEFFEELGTFVKIGAIPNETMWDVQSWNIEYYWGMFESGIIKARKNYKERVYSDFEELFHVMRKISNAKSAPSVDEASIGEFVEREIRATKACLALQNRGPTHGV